MIQYDKVQALGPLKIQFTPVTVALVMRIVITDTGLPEEPGRLTARGKGALCVCVSRRAIFSALLEIYPAPL